MEANFDSKAAAAVEILTKGQELGFRFAILIEKAWPGDSSTARGLFEEVMSSFSSAIDKLESEDSPMKADTACIDEAKDETSGKKRKNTGVGRGGYRRRKKASKSSTITSHTSNDGYSWRKYGQKDIQSSKFPRSYYRCTHKYDQGCQATKQVQKSEQDPSLFEITYMEEHTCKDHNNHGTIPNMIMPSPSCEPSIISFGSNMASNLTQDFSPLFAMRPENEEEVLSNPRPSAPSTSGFSGLQDLYEGPLLDPLMNVPAAQRGDEIACNLDMSPMMDPFNFEEDVFAGDFFGDLPQ